MSDSGSNASDSDNALLTANNHSRISRNAATQTPELPRHVPPASVSATQEKNPSPSSVVVLRVDKNTKPTDLDSEARALDIPDVIVEYIKDSCGLTNGQDSLLENDGVSNPGFVLENGTSTPAGSYHDDSRNNTPSEVGSTVPLHATDFGKLYAAQNRMYQSMPKSVQKKFQSDLKIHSQPSTPKLHRSVGTNENGTSSASSMSFLQPHGSTPFSSVPPSPNFGYRPLESETSAVYTITKTFINDAGIVDSSEVHLLPTLTSSEKSTPKSLRKFEYTPAPPEVERRRRHLQCFTDAFSLLLILPGLFLVAFTPAFIVPMFYYPMTHFLMFLGFFVASGSLSVVFLTLSGLVGNLVWHYDEKSKKIRLRMHCGRGPLRFFWGNGFYELRKKNLPNTEITV